VRKQSQRDAFLQERMNHLLLLPPLPRRKNILARVVAYCNPAALRLSETVGRNLPAVDQRQRKPVRYYRPQLLERVVKCTVS
jgi:hypothetical protein